MHLRDVCTGFLPAVIVLGCRTDPNCCARIRRCIEFRILDRLCAQMDKRQCHFLSIADGIAQLTEATISAVEDGWDLITTSHARANCSKKLVVLTRKIPCIVCEIYIIWESLHR